MRLDEIQAALRSAGIDAWLFFDHHQRDPLAYHILGLPLTMHASRRWYYLVPASGEPVRLVHRIESGNLDAVPGEKRQYSRWSEQKAELQKLLGGLRRVAMQYSPDCAVPYVSMVDAGTLELVRATGVEVVTSADLVQVFEATLSEEQRVSHFAAGKKMDAIRKAAFAEIGRRLSAGRATDEWAIHCFIREAYDREGLLSPDGPIVGVNANASNPHYEPTGARSAAIRPGDLVLIDMWSKLTNPGAVYYDITWTGFCGASPKPEMQKVFEVVRDARNAGIERVQEGIASGEDLRGFQVDDATRGAHRFPRLRRVLRPSHRPLHRHRRARLRRQHGQLRKPRRTARARPHSLLDRTRRVPSRSSACAPKSTCTSASAKRWSPARCRRSWSGSIAACSSICLMIGGDFYHCARPYCVPLAWRRRLTG